MVLSSEPTPPCKHERIPDNCPSPRAKRHKLEPVDSTPPIPELVMPAQGPRKHLGKRGFKRKGSEVDAESSGEDLCKSMEKLAVLKGPLLRLPRIKPKFHSVSKLEDTTSLPFDTTLLAWALQQSIPHDEIKAYILAYHPESIRQAINNPVKAKRGNECTVHIPILFFAVEPNCSRIVRLFAESGAVLTDPLLGVPLLSYAIMYAEVKAQNTTDIVLTLLGLGADPMDVPKDMWVDYIKCPQSVWQPIDGGESDLAPSGITAGCRPYLARNLNLTQRYFLAKSATLIRPSGRMRQIATAHKMSALLEAPYHLIGQTPATTMVLSRVFGHIALRSPDPLVLVYAGPSGHGKTELAKQMGVLLSLNTHIADCTEMRYETDLFGPKYPYSGHENGSPLNNYLALYTGKRAIVFLDEFEKTTDSVRQALLLVFDSGQYTDRRNGNLLDCGKIIWILATNHGEQKIGRFYEIFLKDKLEEVRAKAPLGNLDTILKKEFANLMGAPLTGRFTMIVPFFPFSPSEAAVITHKFLLSFTDTVRQPIDLISNTMIGHLHLKLHNDGHISQHLAKIGYDNALGARSLARIVQQKVQLAVAETYLNGDDEITEDVNSGPLWKFVVKIERRIDGEGRVIVERDGFTEWDYHDEDDAEWVTNDEASTNESCNFAKIEFSPRGSSTGRPSALIGNPRGNSYRVRKKKGGAKAESEEDDLKGLFGDI